MKRLLFLVEGQSQSLSNFSGIPHFFARALQKKLLEVSIDLKMIDTSALLNVEEALGCAEALRRNLSLEELPLDGEDDIRAAKLADPINRSLLREFGRVDREDRYAPILASYYDHVAAHIGKLIDTFKLPGDAILSQNHFYPYAGPRRDVHYYLDASLAGFYFDPIAGVVPEGRRFPDVVELYVRLEHDVLIASPHVFCFSEALRKELIGRYGLAPARCSTAYAGINFDECPRVRPRARGATLKLLFVGLDFIRKGGATLLAAMGLLRGEPVELTVVTRCGAVEGQPPPNVLLRPPATKAELAALYEESDVFVFPTTFEPFGLVVCEAMAYGLAIVAAHTPAMPEIVGPMGEPFLVQAGDAEALADAIRRLSVDEPLLQSLSAHNRLRAERFQWQHVVEHILNRCSEEPSSEGVAVPP